MPASAWTATLNEKSSNRRRGPLHCTRDRRANFEFMPTGARTAALEQIPRNRPRGPLHCTRNRARMGEFMPADAWTAALEERPRTRARGRLRWPHDRAKNGEAPPESGGAFLLPLRGVIPGGERGPSGDRLQLRNLFALQPLNRTIDISASSANETITAAASVLNPLVWIPGVKVIPMASSTVNTAWLTTVGIQAPSGKCGISSGSAMNR